LPAAAADRAVHEHVRAVRGAADDLAPRRRGRAAAVRPDPGDPVHPGDRRGDHYSLLYVARYRDELRHTEERGRATLRALRGTLEPVLASGGTVIAGLLCLLLSDLKSNSTLGPVAAIGIVFAMTAALTFLPAVLYAAGRVAFWPRRPHYAPDAPDAGADPSAHGVWGRIALAVRRRPRPLWILTAAALAIGCLGVTQL